MKDVIELLEEEMRARRASLRDDGEPLDLALARSRQQSPAPPRRSPVRYLPAAGMAVGTLCISAVVLIDFENKIQRVAREAGTANVPFPTPPTVVIGYSPGTHISSKTYEAPVHATVINNLPAADRVAQKLKHDDPRLLTPMKGTWRRARLTRLAGEISNRTGITLTVTPDLSEKRVTVFAGEKASTLQVLRGVAHLYGSGWFRDETVSPYAYRLRRFDTPQTQGWLNALYQAPQRHAPGMETIVKLSSTTHMGWLERLHEETRRTVISDDTNLDLQANATKAQTLFHELSSRANSAGQLWDSHAGALTFRKAQPFTSSLLPVPPQ